MMSDNYQSETTAPITPTQLMELPSRTTSDQSTKIPEDKNVNPMTMMVIELEHKYMLSGQTMIVDSV